MTSNVHVLPASVPHQFATYGRSHGPGQLLKGWWQAYRARRSKQATVLALQGLDDRILSDIGIDRSEIESVVYGRSGERLRGYRPSRQS
jgi:uncharacterized protein YjiS (DUF1127 family)